MIKKLVYLCFAVVLFTACGDDPIDPCAGVDCGSNGTCMTGICDCEDGYSGDNCEIFDPCFDVDCGDNGTCIDGTCDCEDGYYGDSCELLIQDRFVGTWSGDGCDGEEFNLIIIAGSTIATLVIEEQLFNINANIIDENNFDVPEQEFFVAIIGINVTVVGTGKILENDMLEFDASIAADGEEPQSCVAVLEKQ